MIPRFCSLNLTWYSSSVLCAHLAEKSPIKYYLTRNVTCFIANLLEEAPEISGRKFSRLLETLFTTQQLSGKIVEQVKIEFTKFLQLLVSALKEEFLEFYKDYCSDAFYLKYFEGVLPYSNLTGKHL